LSFFFSFEIWLYIWFDVFSFFEESVVRIQGSNVWSLLFWILNFQFSVFNFQLKKNPAQSIGFH